MKVIGLVAFAAVVALSPQAMAQNQQSVALYSGEVTLANAERFTSTLANHVEEVIGLQISFATIEDGDLLTGESADTGAFISYADSYSGGVEINMPDAYWRHGEWVADGFYTVKYGGMGQGIMAYYLRPADEASIRLSAKPIVTIAVDALPPVERDRTAD